MFVVVIKGSDGFWFVIEVHVVRGFNGSGRSMFMVKFSFGSLGHVSW